MHSFFWVGGWYWKLVFASKTIAGLNSRLCHLYVWQEIVDVIFYIHQDVFVTIFTERTRCFIVDGLFCAAALLACRRTRACHISHISIEWEMSSFKSCGSQLNPVGMARSGKVVGYVGGWLL